MLPARATCLRARHVSQVSRCRELYGKYLQWDGANCAAWIAFAELEASLGELERSRAIFDLAISQQSLDQPEALWKVRRDAAEITSVEIWRRDLGRRTRLPSLKCFHLQAYIDLEIGMEEWERARGLYRALLERTKHAKVSLMTCVVMALMACVITLMTNAIRCGSRSRGASSMRLVPTPPLPCTRRRTDTSPSVR